MVFGSTSTYDVEDDIIGRNKLKYHILEDVVPNTIF
jgi:hypothetical protein